MRERVTMLTELTEASTYGVSSTTDEGGPTRNPISPTVTNGGSKSARTVPADNGVPYLAVSAARSLGGSGVATPRKMTLRGSRENSFPRM